jgi:hypothetical protein
MSQMRGFGIPLPRWVIDDEAKFSYVMRQRSLHRILNFTGRTIDDVVNNPIAKNEVLGYYKLHKFINRRSEIRELERQWNPMS